MFTQNHTRRPTFYLTFSLTHSLTHSFTHSLTHPFTLFTIFAKARRARRKRQQWRALRQGLRFPARAESHKKSQERRLPPRAGLFPVAIKVFLGADVDVLAPKAGGRIKDLDSLPRRFPLF